MGAAAFGATIHNNKVYISAGYEDESGKLMHPLLVYSTNKLTWSVLPKPQGLSAIAVVNNHITLIGGHDISTEEVTNTLFTWYKEEERWKKVLPPMPTSRLSPNVISHDNLLLVTGGVAKDGITVLDTTDVLDLTTMKWTTPEELTFPIPLWQHHLAFCGEYLYLIGVYPVQSPGDSNSQAWRAKWSDVKQTAAPQHSQPQRVVWTRIADPPTLSPTAVSCGGALYTVGGVRDGKRIKAVYAYDTARNQWVFVGDMSVERIVHCAIPLSSASMFVAGGQVVNIGKISYLPLTELLLL